MVEEIEDALCFLREAAFLKELDHPNIVKLLGLTELDKPELLMLCTEAMDHGSLKAFVKSCWWDTNAGRGPKKVKFN